jgi:hypothetical protein
MSECSAVRLLTDNYLNHKVKLSVSASLKDQTYTKLHSSIHQDDINLTVSSHQRSPSGTLYI